MTRYLDPSRDIYISLLEAIWQWKNSFKAVCCNSGAIENSALKATDKRNPQIVKDSLSNLQKEERLEDTGQSHSTAS
jgi:hypothetical protein